MDSLPLILLQSAMTLLVFYLGYTLLLSHETSFKQNRIYLLFGGLLSILIPFVKFPVLVNYQPLAVIQLKAVEVLSSGKPALEQSSHLSFGNVLKLIYLAGILAFAFRFLYQLWVLYRFFKDSSIIKNHFGKIVYTGKRHPVFSFLNFIFVGFESESSKNLDVILEHEKVHIAQLHSIDLLLLEVLAIVQWFNPLVWLYLKSVKQNHEYLADQGVIKRGFSVDAYQYLLLNNYSATQLGFANSFNHSLTFKRLIMMKKISSKKLSALKLMIIIPIALMAVYLVSCSKDSSEQKVLKTDLKSGNTTLEEVAPPPPPPPPPGYEQDKNSESFNLEANESFEGSDIDVKPEFPGGDAALMKYIAENTVYPKEALEKGVEGTVYLRFLITKDGKVGEIKVLKRVDLKLLAEAIRVVSSLPDWKPGMKDGKPVNVWFIIPVRFVLH